MRGLSKEVRLLRTKWATGTGWPKRLEGMEINGIRGWTGQRIDFEFPLVAICGENGSGKSTLIQAAASSYFDERKEGSRKHRYASDFFPTTPWDNLGDAQIKVWVREGGRSIQTSVRKPSERWRGNPDRRIRAVEYIDLSRTQPVAERLGYLRMAKPSVSEIHADRFDDDTTKRLSHIMDRDYGSARMALTDVDKERRMPVLAVAGRDISGFHMGAGELTMAELLAVDPPKYSLLLIDEVETSLHPRAQRRLLRNLAEICRLRELQVILTTHSPYILEELPPEARCYILETSKEKQIVMGVSPEFAMTRMDEEPHPECDLYVEDRRAEDLLRELLVRFAKDYVERCSFITYGAASVGRALGLMVAQDRFPRLSLVFVDGDQPDMDGCIRLPGNDAPERVVFEALRANGWGKLATRTAREFAAVADACSRAMLNPQHHEWTNAAASKLLLGGDFLWTHMCQEWSNLCVSDGDVEEIVDAVTSTLELGKYEAAVSVSQSSQDEPVNLPKEDPGKPEAETDDREESESRQTSLF